MEAAIFQTYHATELSSFVYVALDLEVRIEVTNETMVDSYSSIIRGNGEEISIPDIKSSG